MANPPRGYFHETANGEITMHEVTTLINWVRGIKGI
jgi:hypothetical protein